ncbi:MAG: hypothetical protein OZSIB_2192 [Candidatus Ozemobacter sibiricus]|uniref:Uncharacterized protein n=1 Tax=Candidatus Ozemobacter sibiricus TaxID=2268124 RepID=A0A367ZT50_9BACT|nr:MAG: hypothetical protein OZSIB_2192 [Candidatus Ozemobacter sibiricus]
MRILVAEEADQPPRARFEEPQPSAPKIGTTCHSTILHFVYRQVGMIPKGRSLRPQRRAPSFNKSREGT